MEFSVVFRIHHVGTRRVASVYCNPASHLNFFVMRSKNFAYIVGYDMSSFHSHKGCFLLENKCASVAPRVVLIIHLCRFDRADFLTFFSFTLHLLDVKGYCSECKSIQIGYFILFKEIKFQCRFSFPVS